MKPLRALGAALCLLSVECGNSDCRAVAAAKQESAAAGVQPPDPGAALHREWVYPGAKVGTRTGGGSGINGRSTMSYGVTCTTPDAAAKVWDFYWDKIIAPVAGDLNLGVRPRPSPRKVEWGTGGHLALGRSPKRLVAMHTLGRDMQIGLLMRTDENETISVSVSKSNGDPLTHIFVIVEKRNVLDLPKD